MGIMADRLNSMVLDVRSPDGQIRGVFQNRDELRIFFSGNSYRYYQERTLEFQLARLATLLWTAYQRAYNAAVSEVMGYPVKDEPETWDANRRRFRAEQAETTAEGMSAGKVVFAQNTGMLSWRVVIRDGTIARVDQEEFATECVSAFNTLMSDYSQKMSLLRAKHYGTGRARADNQPTNTPGGHDGRHPRRHRR